MPVSIRLGDAESTLGILRVDAAHQPILRSVGDRHRLVLVLELGDGLHRPEDLLELYAHRRGHAHEQGWRDIEALGQLRVAGQCALGRDLRTLFSPDADVVEDLLLLLKALPSAS